MEWIPSYLWFAAKLLALLLGFVWIRATLPRLRMDQLTRLAWKFMVPLALINLGTAAFWARTRPGPARPSSRRWAIALALVIGPFLLLARRLTAGLGPRTYRYAAS